MYLRAMTFLLGCFVLRYSGLFTTKSPMPSPRTQLPTFEAVLVDRVGLPHWVLFSSSSSLLWEFKGNGLFMHCQYFQKALKSRYMHK